MTQTTKNKPLILAIAGNPNSGKTTLFNSLTGLRHKVANYPGVTVEKKIGQFSAHGHQIELLDLPGTYALSPRSEEEKIAADIIQGKRDDVQKLDGLLCVIDSTTLERSLYLALQIIQTGTPLVVLLNMADELEKRGAEIDTEKLSSILGAPVIQTSAAKGKGIDTLKKYIQAWAQTPPSHKKSSFEVPNETEKVSALRKRAKEICAEVLRKKVKAHPWSDKIDRVVMHPVGGPFIFAGVVMVVFQSLFTWAAPFMDLIDGFFSFLNAQVKTNLPDGMLTSFLADGIVAGVGSVVIFLPQILIVFFFIAILENSGYMARAAMVMDRFFQKVGLQGKSFLPLISSYACAVPGIMAARTIESKRDRFATILIAPFMTCSARLPVYALLISAFIPNTPIIKGLLSLQSLTLILLYFVGFAAAMLTAFFLKSSILKSERIPFILDIPPYRLPTAKTIFLLMWDRSKIFLKRASTIILGTTIALWVLVSFPKTEGPNTIKQSYAGQIGTFIEPAIEPLGFNWKIGVGLVAAQAAREVLVSSLSTIYSIEEADETSPSLHEALKTDLTPLAAVSLMVFFVFAMQCMSTIAIVKRETGGWKIPIFMFVYMNAYAYTASLIVFQGGKLLGFH